MGGFMFERATQMLVTLVGLSFCSGCLTASDLPVAERADVIISGVTVINPAVERLIDYSIVVRDGSIREVRPRRTEDPEPICPGCYAIPGLIDAHVHTPPRIVFENQRLFALLYLAHGVTTIRDVGASDGSVADLAARLNEASLVGPRMFRCGPVLDGDPPGWPVAISVGDANEGAAIVDELAEQGVDCIKVYNEMSPEAFGAIAAAAQRHGLPLIGHVPHGVGLAGVTDFEVQHMTGVPYLAHSRPPLGWDIRDEDILLLTPDEIEEALEVAQRQRLAMTPTLANFRLRLTDSDPERFPPSEASHWLPRYWNDVWHLVAGHPTGEEAIDRRLRAIPVMQAMVRRAHERGIDVLAGTDTLMPWVVPGDALHRELAELSVALGSAEAALAAATTVNGRHLASGQIGVLAPGARADILLTAADPTMQLSTLRDWRIVFADGRRYDRATVDAWLEAARDHFDGWFHRHVIGTLVSWVAGSYAHG
jgi:cytosine/adenosine deaminase-related metal-dependent hydrolase